VGFVSTLTSDREVPNTGVLSRLSTTAEVGSADSALPEQPTLGPEAANTVLARWSLGFVQGMFRFIVSAWWILPVPVLFSLWRQFRTWEGCASCRSAHLTKVPSPFDVH
jgi:hypothetical protein